MSGYRGQAVVICRKADIEITLLKSAVFDEARIVTDSAEREFGRAGRRKRVYGDGNGRG